MKITHQNQQFDPIYINLTIEIKYRNGFPVKQSLINLIVDFFKDTYYAPRPHQCYSNVMAGILTWHRSDINDKIVPFIDYLKTKDILVESYSLYNSPSNGHIKLKKK